MPLKQHVRLNLDPQIVNDGNRLNSVAKRVSQNGQMLLVVMCCGVNYKEPFHSSQRTSTLLTLT